MTFVPLDISIKLAISLGVGLLVGLEREWSQKDLGARTFAIAAMAGTLSILAGPGLAYLSFAGLLGIAALTGVRNIREGRPIEATTFAAVSLTFVLGVLVGQGHHYTPVAAAIVMTLLLSLKPALTHFSGGLSREEVRSAVLLGLLAFVVYPVLPDRTVDPWKLVNPREAWLTVVLIAALGFVNYLLLKIYSSRGLYYSALLGGMVNSTATIAELAGYLKDPNVDAVSLGTVIDLLTIVAMFARNLLILVIFARAAALRAVAPLGIMALASLLFLWQQERRGQNRIGQLKLSSPLQLLKVLKFGLIFLVIEIIGQMGQRYFGHLGFLVVSVIGGLVSSASTAGAAAVLAMHGTVSAQTAGLATVLTSMTSALSNLPFVHSQVRNRALTRRLIVCSGTIVTLGVAATLIVRQS